MGKIRVTPWVTSAVMLLYEVIHAQKFHFHVSIIDRTKETAFAFASMSSYRNRMTEVTQRVIWILPILNGNKSTWTFLGSIKPNNHIKVSSSTIIHVHFVWLLFSFLLSYNILSLSILFFPILLVTGIFYLSLSLLCYR
jgi:hypothetical protein